MTLLMEGHYEQVSSIAHSCILLLIYKLKHKLKHSQVRSNLIRLNARIININVL